MHKDPITCPECGADLTLDHSLEYGVREVRWYQGCVYNDKSSNYCLRADGDTEELLSLSPITSVTCNSCKKEIKRRLLGTNDTDVHEIA